MTLCMDLVLNGDLGYMVAFPPLTSRSSSMVRAKAFLLPLGVFNNVAPFTLPILPSSRLSRPNYSYSGIKSQV